MKPFLKLKSVDEVLDIIAQFAHLPAEKRALDAARGLRLAQNFYAPRNLPGFARSTVDGYAARASDTFGASEGSPACLDYVGACVMGQRPDFKIARGQTASILTGGMLPEGADCAIMVEHSRNAGPDQVEIARSQAPGDNTVAANEDAARGALLMPAGKKLRPQEIGLLAAFGLGEVDVTRPARVAIISSGDEIAPLGQKLELCQMYDVNSHSLAALCQEALALPQLMGIVSDEKGDLEKFLRRSLEQSDVIVVSGGSSAGMRDCTVEAFTNLPNARLLVHGAAISPGKPFILATAGAKILMGLPGHVASALICARVFLLPLIHRLQGARAFEPQPTLMAKLTRPVASAQGRRDYIRCRLHQTDGGYEAEPLLAPSAVISGLVAADGLVICPENCEGLSAGQMVPVTLLT